MLRGIAGIIVGYIAMAAFVFGTFTGLYFALGPDGSFKPGSYEPSTLWLGATFGLALVAAVLGGLVCRAISRRAWPGVALAVIFLGLGFAMAIPILNGTAKDPGPRPAGVTMMDAMTKAVQPDWVAVLNPV